MLERVFILKIVGGPVIARAEVLKVEQYSDLNPIRIEKLLEEHIEKIGFSRDYISEFMRIIGDKNYGILAFLKDPQEVEQFYINKKGFGIGSAWLVVESVDKLRKN